MPSPRFEICLSVSLCLEWQAVLTRPQHLPPGITPSDALNLLRYLPAQAHLQDIHFLWRPCLCDPDDDMVLELAVAAGEKMASLLTLDHLRQEAAAGRRDDFERFLAAVPDREANPGDEIGTALPKRAAAKPE